MAQLDSGVPRRATLLKLHRADLAEEETAALAAVLASGWLTKGPQTQAFEQALAARVQAPHAWGCNSCTAALHLALLAAGIGPGDEVIVPAMTFAATANVVVHCGATPVFADALPDTHCIDPAHVRALITPRTKALMPVHYAGIPADLDALGALAQQHGLFLVEDCAHAVEAEYRGRPVGVGGSPATRFAAYSFYATKNLITGEGGMLACRSAEDLERVQVLGLHGMSADAWRRYAGAEQGANSFRLYDIVAAGFKYNMFDLQAALGLVQLAKLDANWERRRAMVARYDALLQDLPQLTPLTYPAHVKPAHHLYVVRLAEELAGADGAGRNRVIEELRARNVEAYVHYICLTGTRYYREQYATRPEQTPVAASLAHRSITLPLYPAMSADDVAYVAAMLREAVAAACG